jgi:SAM-dependent methyltransferase
MSKTEGRIESVESDYYAFMGFDVENARRALRFYTQFFPSGPVLELACGPGVFLSLLAEDGVAASGVDIDDGMVAQARDAGHDVVLDDAVSYLRSLPDRSLRGLFCAHFLEHLAAPAVQEVYTEARRVLESGGTFVAAVPNAACLSVLGYDFWRDPTHVRFYDPLALQFFARQAGLAITASGPNPFNHPGPPPELLLDPSDPRPSLRDDILATVRRVASPPAAGDAASSDEPAEQNEEARSWLELGNILSHVDERILGLQHELGTLRTAYRNLIRQLYPANEVYVAATVPGNMPEPSGPVGAKVEGTS